MEIGEVTYSYTMFHYFRRWMDESARVIATSTHNIFQSRSESCLSWYAELLAHAARFCMPCSNFLMLVVNEFIPPQPLLFFILQGERFFRFELFFHFKLYDVEAAFFAVSFVVTKAKLKLQIQR